MAFKSYQFVGLSAPVYLPDDIAVEIAIVPASLTNIRSNQPFSGQTTYTQHETANFNAGANADMHKRWLHGGAGGSYVGFNFVVDDKKIIQLTPLNEVTWHAGTPDGNRYSWGTELCVNSDINHTQARRNAAALAGGVLAAKGWSIDKLVQHNIWWGKDCPYLLRREGRWATFVAAAASFITSAKQAAGAPAEPTYPAARPVAELADKRPYLVTVGGSTLVRADLIVKATKSTPRLMYADAKSERIGPDINAGEQFGVDYLVLNPDGSRYWYTSYGTRVKYEDTEIVAADAA